MPALNTLVFGHTFTDHMLEIDWDIKHGWHSPKIHPYQNLSLSPASTALHYGIEVSILSLATRSVGPCKCGECGVREWKEWVVAQSA